MQKSNKTEFLR